MKKKRLIVISDLHCGDRFGLRPENKILDKFYKDMVKKLSPVDVVLMNGDAIQGTLKGKSNDIIEPDLGLQAEMALDYIRMWKAKNYILTKGTGIHVSESTDWEKWIGDQLGASVKDKHEFEIFGLLFNAKHHTSKTSIPHGQGTLIEKRVMWELIKSQIKNIRKADIIIRSHIHEFIQIKNKMGFAITTPCFQLTGSAYGRKFDGWYDVGMVHFDVYENGTFDFQEHIIEFNEDGEVLKL